MVKKSRRKNVNKMEQEKLAVEICEGHCKYVLQNHPFDNAELIIEGVNTLGVCGNPCGFNCGVFLKQCGGCRSGNNSCSFAARFEDKVCPNVKCARKNNLEGCYKCVKLEDCKIGFFGLDAFFGKASALFIKKYGEECYLNILKKAINTGEEFIKSFFNNGADGVNGTLKLLEKHME
jgi:hypothetical protein